MNRQVLLIFCAAGALALAGCGGGSSSSEAGAVAVAPAPAPAPAPSTSPTPSPSPTPTPTPLAGRAALTQVQDFAVLGYSVTGTASASGSSSAVQKPGGVAFRYIASQDRHELLVPGADWGILGSATTLGTYPFSFQRVTVGTGASALVYDLSLFLVGDRNGALPLFHTSYGSWFAGALPSSDPTKPGYSYGSFSYGVPTPDSAVPRTGIGQYRGIVFDPYDARGDVALTVDFATGQVSGSIEPFFNDGIGGIGSAGAYPLSGSIPQGASAFQVSFPIGATGRTGLLEVQLTGPAAQELMLRWSATITVPHLSPSPAAYILPGVARRT